MNKIKCECPDKECQRKIINQIIKEFEKKFIKKISTKIRLMDLNGEEYLPILITKEKWKKFKEQL